MMKDDLEKSVQEKKPQATSAHLVSSPQELTCTEGQIEDLLAEGETTEPESDSDDADDSAKQASTGVAERKPLPSTKSKSKSNRKTK